MYYFAYASNLSRKQMAERCPAAKPKFVAKLPHYKLVFTGWSRKWRGGCATIRQSKGDIVVGALYEISDSDLRLLDKYEDYPMTYDHLKVKVVTEDGDFVEAVTYIKTDQAEETKPSPEYLALIQRGYQDWGLASKSGKSATLRIHGGRQQNPLD
ncbi:MAG: gamma-glutamylcyclotransferase family protein [Dehalococcoidia bacterium]|nr:gamma-glutamylcyclotransferase family protein [Dehalococcoidia bacterium]